MKRIRDRDVRQLAASLLVELGRVPDPRFAGLGASTIREVVATPAGAFDPDESVRRQLTDAEADAILAAYFAWRSELAGEAPRSEPDQGGPG